MSEPITSGMEGAAREWAQKNADDLPPQERPTPSSGPTPPNPNAPGSTATPAAPVNAQSDDDDDDDDEAPVDPAEAAAFVVGLIDIALTNFVSPKLEFSAKQEKKLVKLATPLAKKYLPDVSDVASPEIAFAVGLGVICLKNYTTPDPDQPPASPPGGSESPAGNSGDPSTTTEAKVDGKSVRAEVLA